MSHNLKPKEKAQELSDKHKAALSPIVSCTGYEIVNDITTDNVQISIQFAIDLLENCYGDDDTTAGQVSDNVKNRIEELKQQLKP